jgi:hypothetical protein
VALWAFDLHFFSAIVAVDIEKGRLVAKYAIYLKRLRAFRTALVVSIDFRFAFRAPDVKGRLLAAVGAARVFGHNKL